MGLLIRQVGVEAYEAKVTPPHSRYEWSTTEPLPVRALIEELQRRGCHQQDIGDALYEIDPLWVSKL